MHRKISGPTVLELNFSYSDRNRARELLQEYTLNEHAEVEQIDSNYGSIKLYSHQIAREFMEEGRAGDICPVLRDILFYVPVEKNATRNVRSRIKEILHAHAANHLLEFHGVTIDSLPVMTYSIVLLHPNPEKRALIAKVSEKLYEVGITLRDAPPWSVRSESLHLLPKEPPTESE